MGEIIVKKVLSIGEGGGSIFIYLILIASEC